MIDGGLQYASTLLGAPVRRESPSPLGDTPVLRRANALCVTRRGQGIRSRVVESKVVETPGSTPLKPPIGILAALAAGFDRIAARPALILPPLALDLFLWLGPQLRATGLIRSLANAIAVPSGIDPALVEQVEGVQKGFAELALRFNIVSALSAIPAGIPSLMAARMPVVNPVGAPLRAEVGTITLAVVTWALFTVIGLGVGALFQVVIARQVAPRSEIAPLGLAWGRFIALSAGMYAGLLALMTGAAVVVSLATLVLPILGAGLMFIAFSFAFWLAVYLAFTPHGIIRYRLGVWKAMRTSMQVVRWNMPSSVAFLALIMLVTYAAGWVWAMPAEDSWFSLLALVGHAFVSATLVAASYAFYQGRHEWMETLRRAFLARAAAAATPAPRGEE